MNRRSRLTIRRPRRRRGSMALQVVMVMPILLIVTLAIFQFGVLLLVHQAITHAATVAAREAAKGADPAQLECIVEEVLKPHGIYVGPTMGIVLEDPDCNPPLGDLACSAPPPVVLQPDEVRVTICVDATTRPFFNPLKYLGLDLLTGNCITVSAIAQKELPLFPPP